MSMLCSAASRSSMFPEYADLNSSNLRFRSSGSLGMSSIMCGVSQSLSTPCSSIRDRMARDFAISLAPSSTPGSTCEWQSTKPLSRPDLPKVVFLENQPIAYQDSSLDPYPEP